MSRETPPTPVSGLTSSHRLSVVVPGQDGPATRSPSQSVIVTPAAGTKACDAFVAHNWIKNKCRNCFCRREEHSDEALQNASVEIIPESAVARAQKRTLFLSKY